MERRPKFQKMILIRVEPELHRALKVLAAKKATTMSAIIRRSLRRYTDVFRVAENGK